MAVGVRKLVLLALNLMSTILTLLTGLRENPVVVLVSGRYDHIRSRLMEGTVNYNIIREDVVFRDQLTDLKRVGESFRFISAPRRSPENLGEDRSTCVRVNSMNATMMTLNYDDFWGYGPRRSQVFLYSISAPQCHVVNFQQAWYETTCIQSHGGGDESKCQRYILDHFDVLESDRVVQVGVEVDFGIPGVPFLKCLGRPERQFEYFTDLMVHQSYWAGGSYHVELQTSRCLAKPVLRNADWKWGLFKVEPADYAATVVFAVDNSGWLGTLISIAYGLVSIVMIVHGVLAAILRARTVKYLPGGARFLKEWRVLKYVFPFMNMATLVTDNANRIITFKGASFMASDVWMNHWLYIWLSILDALVSIRTTYIILEMGTWMLTKQVNAENFIFMCSALTRITWIMCLVHSAVRLGSKLALRSIKSLKIMRPALRDKIEWYVDASSLFLSYKLYSILLCAVLFLFLQLHGSTTLMGKQLWYKQGVYGGDPNIAQFWGNEIICDLFVIVAILLATGLLVGALTLCTKYRYVANNRLIRTLQDRFIVVGWDVFITLEALGMDPYNPDLIDDDVCRTNCSIGAVLQQLYTSGLSGYVSFAGDYLFLDNGFSKEPMKAKYPVKRAVEMGLCEPRSSSSVASAKYNNPPTETVVTDVQSKRRGSSEGDEFEVPGPMRSLRTSVSLFDRKLKFVTEGYFGKSLLVDEQDPGRYTKTVGTGVTEFEVQDALSTLTIMDIKPLLGSEKKLRIR